MENLPAADEPTHHGDLLESITAKVADRYNLDFDIWLSANEPLLAQSSTLFYASLMSQIAASDDRRYIKILERFSPRIKDIDAFNRHVFRFLPINSRTLTAVSKVYRHHFPLHPLSQLQDDETGTEVTSAYDILATSRPFRLRWNGTFPANPRLNGWLISVEDPVSVWSRATVQRQADDILEIELQRPDKFLDGTVILRPGIFVTSSPDVTHFPVHNSSITKTLAMFNQYIKQQFLGN